MRVLKIRCYMALDRELMGYSSHLFLLFLAEDAQLTPLLRLGAGACAGIIAMSATYPMDMVRGRLTVQVLSSFLIKEIIFSKMSWILFIFEYWELLLASQRYCNFPLSDIMYLQTENSPYQYRGMFHALSTVLRQEGPRALYKGWLPSVIGVVSQLFAFVLFILDWWLLSW